MPAANDLAEIVVNGARYSDWTSVSVERGVDQPSSLATLTVVERGSPQRGWSSLRLKPGDKAQVFLAGRKVIDGAVVVRAPSYNAEQHGIQIVVASNYQLAIKSSVEVRPGEFKNHTFAQISKSVLGQLGIGFSFLGGVPEGADKKFPKINMGYGEQVHAFVERLTRMRNLFLIDDVDGNLRAFRATGSESAIAELQEGRNIFAASGSIRNDNVLARLQVAAQGPGSDHAWGMDVSDVSAKATNPAASDKSYGSTYLEEPGDKDDCRMRVDRETAECMATAVDVSITVKGWQLDDGSLWIEHVTKPVTVYSPRLFPEDAMKLYIRSVTHRQANPPVGTDTEIQLCLESGFGAKPRPNVGPVPNLLDPGNTSATPDGEDT